jgi:large subunit ribosomal protein L10
MKKEEKHEIVLDLKEKIAAHNAIYITDTSNLTVAQVNVIRRKCFEKDIKIQVAKNTLIRKAMEASGSDYSELFSSLKGTSAIMFSNVGNLPAKLIQEIRGSKGEKPLLKAACIDSAIFIGDNQLDALSKLKSKEELIGDIIALLQSPAKNVVSGLKNSGGKLAGILKTLEERGN